MHGLKKIHVTNIEKTVDMPQKLSEFQLEQLNSGKKVDNKVNFFEDIARNFQIKIFECMGVLQVVITNGKENFTIERLGGADEHCLRKSINQIGDKQIYHISDSYKTFSTVSNQYYESFYLVASDKFDDEIHIFNSHNINFHDSVKRSVQPDSLIVFDLVFQNNGLQMLTLNDGEFMLDRVQIDMRGFEKLFHISQRANSLRKSQEEKSKLVALNVLKRSVIQNKCSYLYSPVRAFSISWPYVTFSGLGNYLLIVNAFSRKTIHRVQIAPSHESIKICETFISSTKDLFLVIYKDSHYVLLTLNLDNINQFENKRKIDGGETERGDTISEDNFKFEKLLEYPASLVNNKPLLHLFIRGSSRKEVIQLNYKLTAFFLHEGALYTWSESDEGAMPEPVLTDPDQFMIQSKRLVILDDNNFYFCK